MKKFERKAQSQPKHGPPSVSSAPKATALPTRRPEWSGSGYTRRVVRQHDVQAHSPAPTVHEHILPAKLQQLVLDTIRTAFPASNEFAALGPALRDIKDAIACHDLEKAFANEECLEAYTIRWGPSRALAYANVLAWVFQEMEGDGWVDGCASASNESEAKIVCFGRGAAEFMAIAALIKHLQSAKTDDANQLPAASLSPAIQASEPSSLTSGSGTSALSIARIIVAIADTADWSNVISKLHSSLTTPRALSSYATAKARASNSATLSPQDLKWTSTQLDVLGCETQHLTAVIGPDPVLVTLSFTVSELYARSIPRTTRFLRDLTTAAPRGTLLLIVDHLEASVTTNASRDEGAQQDKTFPVDWLLYQALLPRKAAAGYADDKAQTPPWEKLVEDHNRIFKLAPGLRFPGSLENIKFQIHLLRRL